MRQGRAFGKCHSRKLVRQQDRCCRQHTRQGPAFGIHPPHKRFRPCRCWSMRQGWVFGKCHSRKLVRQQDRCRRQHTRQGPAFGMHRRHKHFRPCRCWNMRQGRVFGKCPPHRLVLQQDTRRCRHTPQGRLWADRCHQRRFGRPYTWACIQQRLKGCKLPGPKTHPEPRVSILSLCFASLLSFYGPQTWFFMSQYTFFLKQISRKARLCPTESLHPLPGLIVGLIQRNQGVGQGQGEDGAGGEVGG